ncbi:MAG: hypothetical protein IJ087_07890 [Eggerthellaceae bacterium]|nr:hypothetical protein [Eggerthellaceae bacterium]
MLALAIGGVSAVLLREGKVYGHDAGIILAGLSHCNRRRMSPGALIDGSIEKFVRGADCRRTAPVLWARWSG